MVISGPNFIENRHFLHSLQIFWNNENLYDQLHNNNILVNDLLLLTDVYMVSIEFYKYTLCLHSQIQTFVSFYQGRNSVDRLKRENNTLKEDIFISNLIFLYISWRCNNIQSGCISRSIVRTFRYDTTVALRNMTMN